MKLMRFGGALAALMFFSHGNAVEALAQDADVQITKTLVDPAIPPFDGISIDSDIVYEIEVTNNGPVAAALTVSVSDSTPAGLSFVENTGDCTTAFPCDLGTIAPFTSKTITTTFNVPDTYAPPSAIENTAVVTWTELIAGGPFVDSSLIFTPVNGINCGNFAVSAGNFHTCAIVAGNGKPAPNTVEDDLLECWGDNLNNVADPLPAGPFVEISAGDSHNCARRNDGVVSGEGTVACWGFDGDDVVTDTPTDNDFTQICAGFGHACGVHSTDNSIECWGSDFFGEASPPAGIYLQVACGGVHSCGLKSDGSVICWGYDSEDAESLITGVPAGTDFVEVVAANEHACARRSDGSVACWGTDFSGETADQVGPFSSITAGAEQNCGIKAGNLVECWGGNFFGEGTPPGEAFTAIEAGDFHVCGLLEDGTILCWGDNTFYQSTPPTRSDLCPVCGDGLLEGRETCEACADPEFCDVGTCVPDAGPPEQVCNATFDICCSPVTCTTYRLSEAHVCRPGVGSCDPPEVCDGVNATSCPADDPLRPNGFVCRLALGGCDPAETCDGTSQACPADTGVLSNGTPCRIVAGACDVQETCDGTNVNCPADTFVAAATPCRTVDGVCDVEEACTGTSAACPVDAFKSSSVTCRTATEICDIAENCTGSTADCPDNSFLGGGTTCRAAAGVCDAAETCTGTGPSCPADAKQASTVTCRAVNGGCDVAETCTGGSNDCPADGFESFGTPCRGVADVCDVAETCPGSGADCPVDGFQPSTQPCRAAVDACDVTENCSGAASACPADSFAGSGTPCDDAAFCNGADTCDGSGGCTVHAGDPCPGPDGDGNCAETCDEGADNCNATDTDGSACDDGSICTTGDQCAAGVCEPGEPDDCDDGSLCTVDSCDPVEGCVNEGVPQTSGCYLAGKISLALKDTGFPDKNKMKWGWKKGETFDIADLGTPVADTSYSLCIFDRHGDVPELVGSYVIGPDPELWNQKKPEKVAYKDKPGTSDGVTILKGKSNLKPDKSLMLVKANGANLALPPTFLSTQWFHMDSSLTVQLVNDAGGCWTSDFTQLQAKKNNGVIFKAVGP